MAITAKVRNKQIDTGKVLHALVQGENASGNITFQIIGEEELVEDFNSTYFYLLYTRPSDTRPNVLLLTNKQLQDDVISVTFKPTSYFTAEDGTVQIQIMATDTEGLSIDSETGTISGSVIWQTFPGAMFVHASQLTGTETIIEENVLTQYLAGMQDLNTQTEQAATEAQQAAVDSGEDAEAAAGSATAAQNAKTDAVAARDKAQEWATKSDGKVDNIDYSSKHYASAAKASEQKASEWAEKETAVETGKYSAKHWAEQAHAEFNALDTYVDETLKPALDDYEETKEGELDTYTATKKAELDTYEDSKETELNTYTGTKKTELDTYTGAKKGELDSYVANTNKPALDSYTNNTLKPALLAYEQTQEGTLNTYTGTKKTELDSYVENTSKPSIDDYIEDEKKPEIDAYIAEQAGQFGADVTTLKGNVSALDKRVSNLEESLDVITEIEYPDATYGTGEVPPNKSKYAEVSVLKGVGRVANQCIHDITAALQTANSTINSFADGVTTFTATAKRGGVFSSRNINPLPQKDGHYVLIFMDVKSTTPTTEARLYCYGGYASKNIIASANWQQVAVVVQVSASWGYDFNYQNYMTLEDTRDANWDAIQTRNWKCRNLTEYFNTTDLSFLGATNSAKLATIQRDYPELLEPSDYGTSVEFPTYSAVKSVGKNLKAIESVSATGNGTSIEVFPKTKFDIDFKPNTKYTVSVDISASGISYSATGNLIIFTIEYTDGTLDYGGVVSTNNYTQSRVSYTTYYDTKTVKHLWLSTHQRWTGGTIAMSKWQIEEGSSATDYSPYMTDTLALSDPVTLKGAVAVSEKYYPETGKVTHPIGEHIVTGNETLNYGTWAENTISLIFPGAEPLARSNSKCLTSIYENVTAMVAGGLTYVRFVGATSRWANLDDFKADAVGKTIYYELATPSADTYVDPIPDPFIQVEGGGTIRPVQTNEPEIDSAMTVTYVNKITA